MLIETDTGRILHCDHDFAEVVRTLIRAKAEYENTEGLVCVMSNLTGSFLRRFKDGNGQYFVQFPINQPPKILGMNIVWNNDIGRKIRVERSKNA